MTRVGVIGGGQLAWMMGDAAQRLGIQLVIQTPSVQDPAVSIATDTLLAAIDDAEATARLADQCDVITFENEFIDLEALSHLADQGVRFYPRLSSLAPLLDKYDQRQYFRTIGAPTPRFIKLNSETDSIDIDTIGFPAALKARRHGYDGQGTFIVNNQFELDQAIAQSHLLARTPDWLLEEFIPFDRELAVMAVRSLAGEILIYPVVETQQENQVCQRVLVTGELNHAVVAQVEAIARNLLESLDVVGVFGIEFFLTPDGQVLINETAPRTHNSGHYTLDACQTSQFEQQLRAVCGLPLGDPALNCAGAVMVNLLGFEAAERDYLEVRQSLAALPHATLYWYGKTQSRPGRKLGHVTVKLDAPTPSDRRQQAMAIAQKIEAIWYPSRAWVPS